MMQRYTIKDEKMENILNIDLIDDLNEYTEKFPIFCDFVPSTLILRQMIRRMLEIKDPAEDLWRGFTQIDTDDPDVFVYKPDPEY